MDDPTLFQIESVPPDIDVENPGFLACAFGGGALIKFDSQGRMKVEIAVDPHHDWTALLVKDLRATRLSFLVYLPDPELVNEIGPERVHEAVTDMEAELDNRKWQRAQHRFFDGSREPKEEAK